MNYLCIRVYFHNMSSASGGLVRQTPTGVPWTPLGDFRPHTPSLPTPGKKFCRRQTAHFCVMLEILLY